MQAEIWIHGCPARDWATVAKYALGDDHARSKMQVLIDGRFYDLVLPKPMRGSE